MSRQSLSWLYLILALLQRKPGFSKVLAEGPKNSFGHSVSVEILDIFISSKGFEDQYFKSKGVNF